MFKGQVRLLCSRAREDCCAQRRGKIAVLKGQVKFAVLKGQVRLLYSRYRYSKVGLIKGQVRPLC